MTWLALLFGLLCAFGGLQSGALAQKRALKRIESLVVNLNESLHRTQEELQEVKLCQNQTKKELGKVRREKESLEAALNELAIDHHKFVTKTIAAEFRQNVTTYKLKEELQELKSRFAEIEVGEGDWESRIAMSRALTEVRRSVSQMEGLLSSMSTAINCLKHDVKQIKISKL